MKKYFMFLLIIFVAACGDNSDADDNNTGDQDTIDIKTMDQDFFMITINNLDGSSNDLLELRTLDKNGFISAPKQAFNFEYPAKIALRQDEQEALVIYSSGYYRGVLALEKEGSSWVFTQDISFDAYNYPQDVTFTNDTHALIAVVRSGDASEYVMSLEKVDGQWHVLWKDICGTSPAELRVPYGSDYGLILRDDYFNDGGSVEKIFTNDSATWQVSSNTMLFDTVPYDVALHPNGIYAYIPTYDLDSPDQHNPQGYINRLYWDGNDWTQDNTVTSNVIGSRIAINYDGSLLVIAAGKQEYDHNEDLYLTIGYHFLTYQIDDNGTLTLASDEQSLQLEGFVVNDMVFSQHDLLLVSYSTYSTKESFSDDWIKVFQYADGSSWQPVGMRLRTSGSSYFGAGPHL